ncbi:SUMF1/EgtB/PvdO family nonheme iron enzyme [bacterium]|nr:SUMF1/EgtB/PvdO family nonheme iron enzyme [bacterium]
MKKIFLFILFGAVSALMANNVPVVSNISASQRGDGSYIVDIYYNVHDADGDPMTITLQVSPDSGLTWTFSCTQISGDVGANIYSGNNKHIVWNLGSEHPNIAGNSFKFRINAYDGIDVDPFDWSYVSAGTYTWGQNDQMQTLDYDYMIMTYEVTNAQYKQFLDEALGMGTAWISGNYVQAYYPGDEHISAGNQNLYALGTPSSYKYAQISFYEGDFYINEPSGYNDGDFDNHPVVYVTWFGAWAFAQHYDLRLPTEQEWEKAARASTGYEYPWGNSLSGNRANYRDSGDPWDNGTSPVGYYNGQNGTIDSPSPYGLYDMCGNVHDWTDSWYNSANRVLRGGIWGYSSYYDYLRSWYRYYYTPTNSSYSIGFRCARTP